MNDPVVVPPVLQVTLVNFQSNGVALAGKAERATSIKTAARLPLIADKF
jgi:hypothetical protein